MKKNLNVKRIYNPYSKQDGTRILVDRLWPRGIKKEDAKIDEWIKEIAPSTELRKWYHRDASKYSEFKKKYFKELDDKIDLCKKILQKENKNITLLYSSKDEEKNNALALKEYLLKNFID